MYHRLTHETNAIWAISYETVKTTVTVPILSRARRAITWFRNTVAKALPSPNQVLTHHDAARRTLVGVSLAKRCPGNINTRVPARGSKLTLGSPGRA